MRRPDLALRDATRLLTSRTPSPAADARTLLSHVLDVPPGRLVLSDDLSDAQQRDFDELVARRASGEPVQHLTGRAYFRRIAVKVGPGVFIPRPESELMVGWALEALGAVSDPIVVELCAGSGALSLALRDELPSARIWAVENDPAALQFAAQNVEGTGITLVAGDMGDALHELDGRVDLVIANPPYIPEGVAPNLPVDVRDFDPAAALFSGPDGLDAIRVVARVAARLLHPRGLVVSEHDDTHGVSAPSVLQDTGCFADIVDHLDLAERPRFVTGRRR